MEFDNLESFIAFLTALVALLGTILQEIRDFLRRNQDDQG